MADPKPKAGAGGGADKAGNNQKAVKTEKRDRGPTVHPDYHFITVVMTNGTEFETRSTYGAAGAKLALDIDPNTHPAWTGGQQQLLDRGGRLSRFNSRFGGMFGGQK